MLFVRFLLSIIFFIFLTLMLLFWWLWLTDTVRVIIIFHILLWNGRTNCFLLKFILFYIVNFLFIDFYKLILCQVSNIFVVTKKTSQISLSKMISIGKMLPASYLHLYLLLISPNFERIRMQVSTDCMKISLALRLCALKSQSWTTILCTKLAFIIFIMLLKLFYLTYYRLCCYLFLKLKSP